MAQPPEIPPSKKLAIVTICVGELYNRIAALTHPTIKVYADKVGADFIVMQDIGRHSSAGFQKLEIGQLLRSAYDRVLYIDTDILIRTDAPNIFKEVPSEKIGLFNEGLYVDRRQAKWKISQTPDGWWAKNTYYNTGVMVVSRGHEILFLRPDKEIDNFYEQTHLNWNAYRFKLPIHELPYRFNRLLMMSKITGLSRLNSFFLHYAGQFSSTSNKDIIEMTLETMQEDLAAWAKGGWDPKEDLSLYA